MKSIDKFCIILEYWMKCFVSLNCSYNNPNINREYFLQFNVFITSKKEFQMISYYYSSGALSVFPGESSRVQLKS